MKSCNIYKWYTIHHIIEDNWNAFLFMAKNGTSFARLYTYKNDLGAAYLDWLSVNKECRNKGVGTRLQIMREKMALELGFKQTRLWVNKDTWMHDWYRRRGYIDYADHDTEPNSVWMYKNLI